MKLIFLTNFILALEVATQDAPSCAEFSLRGSRPWYNETIEKCVLSHDEHCSELWSGSRYQCGSGEGGACRSGRCDCDPGEMYAAPVGARRGDGSYDFSCKPVLPYGAPCKAWNSCQRFLDCYRSGICSCDGDWDEEERVCYGNRRCEKMFGYNFFHKASTKQCICALGSNCGRATDPHPAHCPADATLVPVTATTSAKVPDDQSLTCACKEGLTPVDNSKQCAPVRRYGEQCEYEHQCLNNSFCINGTCACYPRKFLWEATAGGGGSGACVVKAGMVCANDPKRSYTKWSSECTRNADCIPRLDEQGWETSWCECVPPFVTQPDGQCGLSMR